MLLGAGVATIIYREIHGNEKSYFGEAEILAGLNPFLSLPKPLLRNGGRRPKSKYRLFR
jgi:hypothetical protein